MARVGSARRDNEPKVYGLVRRLRRIAELARPFMALSEKLKAAFREWDWADNDGPPAQDGRPFEVGDIVERKTDGRRFVVQGIEPTSTRPSGFVVAIFDEILLERDAAEFVAAHPLRKRPRPC